MDKNVHDCDDNTPMLSTSYFGNKEICDSV